jgi:hypothetical protein
LSAESKVAITTGSSNLQRELITQTVCCRQLSYIGIIIRMPNEHLRFALSIKNLPTASDETIEGKFISSQKGGTYNTFDEFKVIHIKLMHPNDRLQ